MSVDPNVRRLGLTVQDFENAMAQIQLLQQRLGENEDELALLKSRGSQHSSGDCERRLSESVELGEEERRQAQKALQTAEALEVQVRQQKAKEAENWKRMTAMKQELQDLEYQEKELKTANQELKWALSAVEKAAAAQVASQVSQIVAQRDEEEKKKTVELQEAVEKLGRSQQKLMDKIAREKKEKTVLMEKMESMAQELKKQHDLETRIETLRADLDDCMGHASSLRTSPVSAPRPPSLYDELEEDEMSLGTDAIAELYDLQNAHADTVAKLNTSERSRADKAAELEKKIALLREKDAELVRAMETRRKLHHAAKRMREMREELKGMRDNRSWVQRQLDEFRSS